MPILRDHFGSVGLQKQHIARRSFAHEDLRETLVMRQGVLKNRCAANMAGWFLKDDSVAGCLCEDERYGQCVVRRAHGRAPAIPGAHADVERRVGYLRAIKARRFFASRTNGSPPISVR
jgi:hypothetical protein